MKCTIARTKLSRIVKMTNIKCIWLLFFFYWFFCSASEQTVQTNQHVHTSCSGKHNFAITWERWVTVFIFAYTFFFLVAEILFIKFALKSDESKVWTTSHIQKHLWALTHYISGEEKKIIRMHCAVRMETNKNEKWRIRLDREYMTEWCSWNRKSWGKIWNIHDAKRA